MKRLIVILLFATGAYGQSLYHYENILLNQNGQPITGATVYVCTGQVTPNFLTAPPCPLATIYSDIGGTLPITQPTTTSPLGNYIFNLAGGLVYTVVFIGPNLKAYDIITPSVFPGVNTVGNNAWTGTNTFGNINNIIYVDGVKYPTLASALAACGSNPCWVIDNVPETFSSNPFASFSGTGCRVDFGNGTWTVNAQIIMPFDCTVNGAGRANTTFKAGGSFPINTAMFRLGPGITYEAGIRLENLFIDCNGITGSQGVYSNSINEQSGLFRILITGCLSHDVLIDMAGGASNFALNFSMNEVELYPNSTSTSVHGIYLRGGNGSFAGSNFKTISNVTVNNVGASVAGDGIRIEDITGGDVIGLHCEQMTTCAHISSTGGGLFTDNISLSDLTHGRDGTQVVLVDVGSNHIDARNIVRQFGTAVTATIQDNVNSRTVAGSSIAGGTMFSTGEYHIGAVYPGASNALTNGAGLQAFNTTTTCTTGASIGATCTTAAITLPVAEADTSYRIVCTGKGLTNVPVVVATTNSSGTQFTITIAALTAAAASFASYDCTAGHN